MNKTALIFPVLAGIVALVLSSLFIVDEREKVLVLQFGQVKQVKEEMMQLAAM
jgi:membrane protease subunit HflC